MRASVASRAPQAVISRRSSATSSSDSLALPRAPSSSRRPAPPARWRVSMTR